MAQVHVEQSETISDSSGRFLFWWESVAAIEQPPTYFHPHGRIDLVPCGHYHRSERTAQLCADRRSRAIEATERSAPQSPEGEK